MLELSVGFLLPPPSLRYAGQTRTRTVFARNAPRNASSHQSFDRREMVWGAQPAPRNGPQLFSRLSRRSQHSMQRFCRALLLCCARRYQDWLCEAGRSTCDPACCCAASGQMVDSLRLSHGQVTTSWRLLLARLSENLSVRDR
jgi:hypothetical protein